MRERRDFIKIAAILGLAPSSGLANFVNQTSDVKVLVVGAGPAGMTVAHLLAQRGIEYEVLEASDTCGGRTKTDKEFVDFPLPLGAEWLHAGPETLELIVNDDEVSVEIERIVYDPEAQYGFYQNDTVEYSPSGEVDDLKFAGHTWLTFYEQYVLPGIKAKLRLDTEIVKVFYDDERVILEDSRGREYKGSHAVITVPPKVIKDDKISFAPDLPSWKRKAFEKADIWTGFKAFFTFRKKFYPTFLDIAGANSKRGQKMFYDPAYGQDTAFNVLGLFSVGDQAEPYQTLSSERLRDRVLEELDEIFDGQASKNYLAHIYQDWSKEPFIHQAYFANSANWRLPSKMRASLTDRVFFAGDTYTDGHDWSSVHAAAQSAKEAVDELLSL